QVDDGVRTQRKRVTNASHEGLRQPPMRQFEDVCGAEVPRNRGGAVGRTVVEDQRFNAIVAGNSFRQASEGNGKRRFFVKTGDLYDQLATGQCSLLPFSR